MRRRLLGSVIPALLLLTAVSTDPAGADPAEAACSVTWGSTARSAGPATSPSEHVVDARTGRHRCYDRFVVDLDAPGPGFNVRYVRHFRHIASGNVIPLEGGARLEIVVRAAAVDGHGDPTYDGRPGHRLPRVDVSSYRTFRQAKYGGTFEGLTSFGLGVRARLPFRVMRLDDRIVVDVAHHW